MMFIACDSASTRELCDAGGPRPSRSRMVPPRPPSLQRFSFGIVMLELESCIRSPCTGRESRRYHVALSPDVETGISDKSYGTSGLHRLTTYRRSHTRHRKATHPQAIQSL